MASDDPNTSDRVLAAEIYTRRIRNTVFGAILLVAWLVLLFKDLLAGLAIGVAAGVLYGIFLLGRLIVRANRRRQQADHHRPTASRSASNVRSAGPIGPNLNRRPEGLEELSEFLDQVKAMPSGTRKQQADMGQALAVGLGMADTPAEQLQKLVLFLVVAALALWPLAVSWAHVTQTPLTFDWWYVVPGVLFVFGGASIILVREPEVPQALIGAALGLWLLVAHPLLGDNDPLTKYVVRPVIDWINGDHASHGARSNVDAIVDSILTERGVGEQTPRTGM